MKLYRVDFIGTMKPIYVSAKSEGDVIKAIRTFDVPNKGEMCAIEEVQAQYYQLD